MNLMQIFDDIPNIINEQFRHIGINVESWVGEVITALILVCITIIIGWIVYHIFEHYFAKWAKKTKTKLDDEILRNIKKPIYFLVLLIGFYISIKQLSVLSFYSNEILIIFTILEIFLISFIITRVINVFVAWYAEKNTKKYGKEANNHVLFVLKKIINVFVYIFAFLFILAYYEIDLSGAVVGLGVGGIAIAFALQSILSDAFSAFSIYFDRPFEIGDFIVFGDYSGTVEKISMKSTRVKLLRGEEVIIPNKELTSTSVRNFKKMKKRRVEFNIGVTYDTPLEKLKKVPVIIKEVIENCKIAEFDMIHFRTFGDFSLNFGIVYYIKTGDYKNYLDVQNDINFNIKEAFDKEKIEIAFPTQTIFLNKN